MASRVKVSQDEIDEARQLRLQGLTIQQIADELSRSPAWVYEKTTENRTYADRQKGKDHGA